MKLSKFRWLALAASSALFANPSDPTIVYPPEDPMAVTFDTSGSTLTVTVPTETRVIVDWDSFSIGSTETTTFDLPSTSSAILNRVSGENASSILGSLQSNGQVFLINENGIVMNGESTISTAAFLASTMDVDNQEFLDGSDMTFFGDPNTNISLMNYKPITTDEGDIVLLGFQVGNWGALTANDGTVALGAGIEIVLQPTDDQRIAIVTNTPTEYGDTGIEGSGSIQALRAELKSDGAWYQYALNVATDIDTLDVNSNNATVRISSEGGDVSISGTITSMNGNGNYGGEIAILGETVSISGGTVDVSSGYGGGVIYIGGEDGSAHPDFFTAEYAGHDSGEIRGNALTAGEGAYVVIKATDTANAAGDIYLNGGASGGNGGTLLVLSGETTEGNSTIEAVGGRGSGSGMGGGNGGVITLSSEGNCVYSGTIDAMGGIGGGDGGTVLICGETCMSSPTVDVSAPAGEAGTSSVCPMGGCP